MRGFATKFSIVIGVSILAACASQGPASTHAPASASRTTADGHVIPDGYQREVINGEERFCSNDTNEGSRVARTKICLTWEELEAQERNHAEITRGFSPVN